MSSYVLRVALVTFSSLLVMACGQKQMPKDKSMGMDAKSSAMGVGSTAGSAANDPGPLTVPPRGSGSGGKPGGQSDDSPAEGPKAGAGGTVPGKNSDQASGGVSTQAGSGAKPPPSEPDDGASMDDPDDDEPSATGGTGAAGSTATEPNMPAAGMRAPQMGAAGKTGAIEPPLAGAGGSTSTMPSAGGSGACALPACLSTVVAACTPTGSCTEQMTGSNVAYCFANGVKLRGTLAGSYTVSKPDGSSCFELEASADLGAFSATYRDPSKAVIATAEQDVLTSVWQFECADGTITSLDPTACGLDPTNIPATGDTSACSAGSCM